jgi:hypothetical protein
MARLAALVLVGLLCIAAAGCARDNSDADRDRYGGFYGGVSGSAVP